ncbi:MAG: serine hydrolase, partial [Prevotella sp.]|nr:serine hydrolase [Prevotella sp.]
ADGMDGPNIFSFERHVHDTVANGDHPFRFPVASKRADWIDTLHFFTQGKYYKNITFPEAINTKSNTQGVLIIQNDSIVYEKYWGDMTSDRLATVFSVSKSITSLMCGIAVDDGYIHSIDPGYYAVGIAAQVLYVNPYKHLIMVRIGLTNRNHTYVPNLFEQLSNCDYFPL